jgi:hypothetical protein
MRFLRTVFNVRPIDAGGQYIAAAFFPANPRSARELVVDDSIFDPKLSVVGVLRHELGHTLGFRHEHTRPEAKKCFEDNNWRALTPYDSASVMHYPQCNGTNTWELPLTARDIQGVEALYGPANPNPDPNPNPNPGTTLKQYEDRVALSEAKSYGPFPVKAGSAFRATLKGTQGDADVYVRFGAAPTASRYNCRPYLPNSNEECRLTAPSTPAAAYVTVVGYSAAAYSLEVEYVEGTSTPTPGGTPKRQTVSGSLAADQQRLFAPLSVLSGSRFVATLTGTGDPDLYVRFGSAPTLTQFDCRPYDNGANETCTLTVPAGATQAYVMVVGYTAATFDLVVDFVAP